MILFVLGSPATAFVIVRSSTLMIVEFMITTQPTSNGTVSL